MNGVRAGILSVLALPPRTDNQNQMTQSNLDTAIRSKIDSFLENLSALVKQTALESVQEALGNGAAPARRGRRMKVKLGRPAKSAMKGGKRSSEDVAAMADKIASFVRSNPGSRLEAIAAGLGTNSKELKLPVIKLLASKKLSKKGQKRGTSYFPGKRK
jgi:hypothetical protein